MKHILFICIASLVIGCQDDFDPIWLLNKPRVLGARASVKDRPLQAWPAPGEQVTIDWLVSDPEQTPNFSWLLGACVAAPTLSGAGLCQSGLLAFSQDSGPAPTFRLTVPSAQALQDSSKLIIGGIVCGRGDIELQNGEAFDPNSLQSSPQVFDTLNRLIECQGENPERIIVNFELTVQLDEESNQHPRFFHDALADGIASGQVEWAGPDPYEEVHPIVIFNEDYERPWLAPEQTHGQDFGSCDPTITDNAHLPVVQRGSVGFLLGIRFDPYSSDYIPDNADNERNAGNYEYFYASFFATAGHLNEARITEDVNPSVLEIPEDDRASFGANLATQVLPRWRPPGAWEEGIPEQAFIVAFYFVVRDLRGGFAHERRLICVQ